MFKFEKGFTLIELLIVITIILILIAIALPNFLEAQTRSKITKVKSEMKSISSALESYRIDWGKYPWAAEYPELNVPAVPPAEPFELYVSYALTSPVSYMNDFPSDIFNNVFAEGSDLNLKAPYHYTTEEMNLFLGEPYLFLELRNFLNLQKNINYFLLSHGPDNDHDEFGSHSHEHGNAAIYNPTNGTTSNGDIYYFN